LKNVRSRTRMIGYFESNTRLIPHWVIPPKASGRLALPGWGSEASRLVPYAPD
jgi:hypothetical protein